MELHEVYKLRNKLDTVSLSRLESIKTGQLCFWPIYLYNILDFQKGQNVFTHMLMMVARCLTRRNKISIKGSGDILCFCSRPMVIERNDHLQNFLKVTNLIKNTTIVIGANIEGFLLRHVFTLILPFVWNHQLKRVLKDSDFRWMLIRNIYSAYMDLLEFIDYQKKSGIELKGVLLLEETVPSSQLLLQYLQPKIETSVVLSHGLYAASEKIEYYMTNWCCDYMIVYSQYAIDLLNKIGQYPGEMRALGMYQYIGQEMREGSVNRTEKIGVFLDYPQFKENLEMIKIVTDLCKNTNKKIYIKLHPSCSMRELAYYKENIDMSNVEGIYHQVPTSLDLEKMIDIFIGRNTTCFIESIYQKIPAFIYNKYPCVYEDISKDICFDSEDKLKDLFSRVENGGYNQILDMMKEYVCGKSDPRIAYTEFFAGLGWE